MDREPHPEQSEPINPGLEQEASPEIETPAIDALPVELGFVETQELSQLRERWVEAMTSGDATADIADRYQALAEELIEPYEKVTHERARIGLWVKIALIRRDAGRHDDYLEDLREARNFADGFSFEDPSSFEDAVSTLETTIWAAQEEKE